MTSRLLMPVRSRRAAGPAASGPAASGPATSGPAASGPAVEPDADPTRGSTRPTAILDHGHPLVAAFTARVREEAAARGDRTDRDRLRTAHRLLVAEVRPVYSVEDRRRASRTLRLGRGSCSQRMGVLEAVARSLGTATRVRGLLVDGSFWYPRFPHLRPFVPAEVLLAWPEFRIDGGWVPIADLFDHPAPSGEGDGGFANTGAETLFEAVARTGVDWDAPAACDGVSGACDLSAHLRTDLGRFASRDELFARHGQTLCRPARTLAEPVLGRWSAGAA